MTSNKSLKTAINQPKTDYCPFLAISPIQYYHSCLEIHPM